MNDAAGGEPSPAELFLIRETWNDTARPFPDGLLIHQLFEAAASRHPEAVALEFGGQQTSYGQLDGKANRLARLLRQEAGSEPAMRVGVCLERGPDLVVAMLAVMKAGAVYVPLDPRYPQDRLALMVREAEIALVITDDAHVSLLGGARCLRVDREEALGSLPGEGLDARARSTDPCCIFFTSGSTGVPNGVLLSHRAIVNTLDWVNRTFGVSRGDRLLFVTSPCFDLSLYDVFGVLGAGATVVIADGELLRRPSRLADTLTARNITIWNSAPAMLSQLVPYLPPPGRSAALRLVLLSGDWIPLTLPDEVRAAFPAASVISLGGATEAAIWSNWFPIGPIDPRWKSIPYGRPIQNCRYYVLDQSLRSVPVGVSGDLYIAGTCLAEGYVNRPALTAERFVRDPSQPDRRLYRTGDLARYFEDGNLEFLGRRDSQVKVRGFRIELTEVEAALSALRGVRSAVCVAQRDGSGEMALHAFVVPVAGTPSVRTIKDGLAATLPPFMIPSQITVLAELPLSPNGKVDRHALQSVAPAASAEVVAPRTEAELRIATLWEELLRRPVGVTDDFFDLGGHSLLAVTLVARLKAQMGIEISVDELMRRSTVEALASGAPAAQGAPERTARFMRFNRGGARPPLVLFPGIFGAVLSFKDLPRALGAEQPLFVALTLDLAATESAEHATIERIAGLYEDELLRLVPDGPIIVGGFSFGATVAFELFHRLSRRGRSVPLLVSLDGAAPGHPAFVSPLRRVVAHLSHVLRASRDQRAAYFRERLSNLRGRLHRLLRREHLLSPEAVTATADLQRRFRRVWRFHRAALARYRPPRGEKCRLLLFRGTLSYRFLGMKTDRERLGWGDFAAEPITVVTVPGGHDDMLAPVNQRQIAEAIAEAVARAPQGSLGGSTESGSIG